MHSITDYFRVFGSMFVAAMAWATLSHYSWRWLTFIAALPVLVSLILGSYYLPESLTWLVVKGKNAEAEELLRQIGAECGVDTAVQTISVRLEDNQKDKASSFWVLFESQTLRSITLKLFAIWFVEGLAYYGIVQFVSRLYMSESDGNKSLLI
jgi:MFS family permease